MPILAELKNPKRWAWPRVMAIEAGQLRHYWRVIPYARWGWRHWPTPRTVGKHADPG